MNEDSKETLAIGKENWREVKELRDEGKYAVLVCNKCVVLVCLSLSLILLSVYGK